MCCRRRRRRRSKPTVFSFSNFIDAGRDDVPATDTHRFCSVRRA